MKHLLKQAAAVAALGSVFFALQLFAFTEPSTAPPGGNVAAPLNVGSSGQSKTGGLILNTGGAANGLIVQNGKVGIGVTSPSTLLEIAQNTALKLGNAYLSAGLLSGSSYAHFSSNAWFDGSTWQIPDATKKSGLLQFGTDPSGNVYPGIYRTKTAGQSDWENLLSADGSGNFSFSHNVDSAGHFNASSLCIGGDCRTSWPPPSSGGNFGGMFTVDDTGACSTGNPMNGGSCSCPGGFNQSPAGRFVRYRNPNSVETTSGTLYQCWK